MEKFSRSKSTREGSSSSVQPSTMNNDFSRSYSTSNYKPPSPHNLDNYNNNFNEVKIKKNRISSASAKNWSFNMDPELQRKKRVASYKAYTVEGKMKGSLRKSFRWIKDVVHGLW